MSFRNNRNRKPKIRGGYNLRRFSRNDIPIVDRCIPGSGGMQILGRYVTTPASDKLGGHGAGVHGDTLHNEIII